jgi:hypothetical protein
MWYWYTIKFHSAMKKNEILSFASKWMILENIILSELSQAQKTKHRMYSLICRLYLEQIQQCCWTWVTWQGESTYKRGMGISRKPKTWKCLRSPLQRN